MTKNKLLQRITHIGLLVLTGLVLSACGGSESVSYSATVTSETTYSTDDEPRIYQFHMIDTYGTNTEFDETTEIALSPYINLGYFETFWEVDSFVDYYLELRVNETPSAIGSRLISSEYCGPGLYCHDYQYQFCEYTSDAYVECESSSGDLQSNYIGDMLHTLPEDLYFILQVCDANGFYCESDALQVSME